MSEQAPKGEEKLQAVISLSERVLEGAQQHPGSAYKPKQVKLGWLFRRAETLGGYEPEPDTYRMLNGGAEWWFKVGDYDSPVRKRVRELKKEGLVRVSRFEAVVGGWYGSISLCELRPAHLVGRNILPMSEPPLYDMQVHMHSSDGKGPSTEYERIIYGSQDGVLEYSATDWLEGQQAEDKMDGDPLERAKLYLQQGITSPNE